MATQHTYPEPVRFGAATTDTPLDTRVSMRERWRQHRAEHKRRVIVQWLRRTASRANETDPMRQRSQPLLHYRAAAVRADLLEIAAMLERTQTPNPACVTTLHRLLSSGCDSPLYNPRIPVSKLEATLAQVRSGL